MGRLAALAILAALALVPMGAMAQSPSPSAPRPQTVCLRIMAPDFADVAGLIRLFDEGLARIIGLMPCREPFVVAPDGSPLPTEAPVATPRPTPAPRDWHRVGQYRYRWLGGPYPRLQAIADKGCASGLRVVARDRWGDAYEGSHDGRVRAGRRVTVDFLGDDSLVYPEDVARVAIRCAPTPWVRTYRGGGSDDRYVTIPANDSIRGRFTVRATSSYGCITGVYVDGEPIDAFDLFYDGRKAKARSAWVDASGRTHLKVISSCPWTLTLTGYRD